jgi:hypothetical protein
MSIKESFRRTAALGPAHVSARFADYQDESTQKWPRKTRWATTPAKGAMRDG